MSTTHAAGEIVGEWRAVNRASGSVGSIHDDATAQKLGFRGGFVGGVTILSYVCEGWRRAAGLSLALRPFRVTVDLRAPLYQGETARVRASRTGARWSYAVEGDAGQVTTDGMIEELDAVQWDDARGANTPVALDGIALDGLPVRRRTFDAEETRRYYTEVLDTDAPPPGAAPVSVGLWANPMSQVIDRLKETHTTVHRSSEMLVARLPVAGVPYRLVDIVERIEPRGEAKALVHVRCDVLDGSGDRLAVIWHRSAVRRRT